MISALVLAAGASRRMGRPKALVKLGKKTILQHVMENLRTSHVDEIVVVLGYKAEAIIPALREMDCRIVVNPDYIEGMSGSIRRGLSQVSSRAKAVLIALGDQPYIPSKIIDLLVRRYVQGNHEIVVPTYRGRRGHPVIFGRKYWPELLALEGDVGGKALLLHHAKDVLEVEVSVRGVLLDIDKPENHREKRSRSEQNS